MRVIGAGGRLKASGRDTGYILIQAARTDTMTMDWDIVETVCQLEEKSTLTL